MERYIENPLDYRSPASVADPYGYVIEYSGGVYRVIEDHAIPIVKTILEHPKLNMWFNMGLVRTTISDLKVKGYNLVLEHQKVLFRSVMEEWCRPMAHDVAVNACELQRLFWRDGFSMKDGQFSNFMVNYTNPVMIDFGSIVPINALQKYRGLKFPWDWSGHFMEDVWECLGIDLHDIREANLDKPNEVCDEFIGELQSSYAGEKAHTEWSGYDGDFINLETNIKHINYMKIISKLHAQTLVDIGANKGRFSLMAADEGYEVVAFDIDRPSIQELYYKSLNEMHPILPLVMDFMNPTPMIARGGEFYANQGLGHEDAYTRLACDVSVFSAVIHHLCLRQGVTFEQVADRLDKFTKKYALVEFIPLEDVHVGSWAKPHWYTLETFIKVMESRGFPYYTVEESAPHPRKWVLFWRKDVEEPAW